MVWLSFYLGAVFGALVGVGVMALLRMARDEHQQGGSRKMPS
jgi:hypothetical protein